MFNIDYYRTVNQKHRQYYIYSDDYSNYCFQRLAQGVEKYPEHCGESRALCIAVKRKIRESLWQTVWQSLKTSDTELQIAVSL